MAMSISGNGHATALDRKRTMGSYHHRGRRFDLTDVAHLRTQVEEALAHASYERTWDDLVRAIDNSFMQLWVSDTTSSIIITEIVLYPRIKTVRAVIAAGDLDEIIAMIPTIAEWALTHDCTHTELCGRRGWERRLSGWTSSAVLMRREITELLDEHWGRRRQHDDNPEGGSVGAAAAVSWPDIQHRSDALEPESGEQSGSGIAPL